MLKKEKTELQDFASASKLEWLETNGLGGWSGSTVIGCNTRRYHGLLVAATVPPAERMVLVSKMEETIIAGDGRYELSSNLYQGETIHPKGYQYLESFTRELFPEWIYEAGGVRLRKTLGMVHGENSTLVKYEVLDAPGPFTLELRPFLAVRGYHELMHANDAVKKEASCEKNILKIKVYDNTPDIFIHAPRGHYQHQPGWYLHYHYAVEKYRGLDYEEDLFTPGFFAFQLKKGDTLGIMLSTENPESKDAVRLFKAEEKRKKKLLKDQPEHELLQQLILAADQFIVRRDTTLPEGSGEAATIIAGYHWFTDWGRDTMIALPGLTLSTGRFADAKKILAAFAQSVTMGMLPNRFQEKEPPEYNNVDGTLWYFIAVYKYLQASNDKKFVLNEILPVLKDIIDWHFKGTRYNIHVAGDGLLFAGEPGQQLTWMDARIGTWVVTPRMGKPVEIQALWYNSLKIFAELLRLNNQASDAELVELSAAKAKESFDKLFWYEEGNYLYDVIDENGYPDPSLRPNQLFAISLPFALLEGDKAASVLNMVEEKLYTAVGLRSLPAADSHYIPHYGGDQWHRDSAYHEGTVWSWLLGAYVDAVMKVKGERSNLKSVIRDFAYHMAEGCIGQVSEIFDADAPHHPRGCVAQAWGVGEILRVIKEYGLYENAAEITQDPIFSLTSD